MTAPGNGVLVAPGAAVATNETAIEEGKIAGDTISFNVTRTFQDNKFTTKYVGKLSGDTIKGSIEMPGRGGGDPRKVDWEAKKEVAK